MTDEQVQPSPLELARMIEDTTKSIMRHVIEPAVMDRVDASVAQLVHDAVERLIDPDTERQLVTMAQENALLRDIVEQVFQHEYLTALNFYISGFAVELTADQLGLIRRIVGLDT